VRIHSAALQELIANWDHSELPDHLAWAEDLAWAVGRLANVVEVKISRGPEGFYARWISEDHPLFAKAA
jgi:hypothetical protein